MTKQIIFTHTGIDFDNFVIILKLIFIETRQFYQ